MRFSLPAAGAGVAAVSSAAAMSLGCNWAAIGSHQPPSRRWATTMQLLYGVIRMILFDSLFFVTSVLLLSTCCTPFAWKIGFLASKILGQYFKYWASKILPAQVFFYPVVWGHVRRIQFACPYPKLRLFTPSTGSRCVGGNG